MCVCVLLLLLNSLNVHQVQQGSFQRLGYVEPTKEPENEIVFNVQGAMSRVEQKLKEKPKDKKKRK